MPEGGSRAPYIIICNGRIDLAASRNGVDRVQAASRAATNLVMYYGERLTAVDTEPISRVQHAMMDRLSQRGIAGVDDLVDQMFALLDALEDKFE